MQDQQNIQNLLDALPDAELKQVLLEKFYVTFEIAINHIYSEQFKLSIPPNMLKVDESHQSAQIIQYGSVKLQQYLQDLSNFDNLIQQDPSLLLLKVAVMRKVPEALDIAVRNNVVLQSDKSIGYYFAELPVSPDICQVYQIIDELMVGSFDEQTKLLISAVDHEADFYNQYQARQAFKVFRNFFNSRLTSVGVVSAGKMIAPIVLLYPLSFAEYFISQILMTKLSDIMFQFLLGISNQRLNTNIVLISLEKIMVLAKDDFHKLVDQQIERKSLSLISQKGNLNKDYQQLVCFISKLLLVVNNHRLITFVIDKLLRILQKYQSYLALFMLRELLMNLFKQTSILQYQQISDSVQLLEDAQTHFGLDFKQPQLLQDVITSVFNTDERLFIELINICRPTQFKYLFSLPYLNFEELSNLLIQTRNDLMFMIYTSPHINDSICIKQIELIMQLEKSFSLNMVLYLGIFITKCPEAPVIQMLDQNKNVVMKYALFFSNEVDVNKLFKPLMIQNQQQRLIQLLYLLMFSPQFLHHNIASFIARLHKDYISFIYEFLKLLIITLLSCTKTDTERVAGLLRLILTSLPVDFQVRSLLYLVVKLSWLYDQTWCDQYLLFFNLLWSIAIDLFAENTLLQIVSQVFSFVGKHLMHYQSDIEDTNVLARIAMQKIQRDILDFKQEDFEIELFDKTSEIFVPEFDNYLDINQMQLYFMK